MGNALRRWRVLSRTGKLHQPGFLRRLDCRCSAGLHDAGRSGDTHRGTEPRGVLWIWPRRLCELHGLLTPLSIRGLAHYEYARDSLRIHALLQWIVLPSIFLDLCRALSAVSRVPQRVQQYLYRFLLRWRNELASALHMRADIRTRLSIRRVEKGPGHTCAGPVLMPGHQYRLLGRMALWRECDMPYRPVYGGLPSRHLGV